MTLIGADITVNATIVKATEHSVLARTKSGYELIIAKADINTIRPKVITDGEDKRKGS